MRNSKKPIKFAHLKKLANQSTLNNSHVIEIKKASTIAFMKARNYLFVGWTDRERQGEKQKMVKVYFLKVLLIVVPGSTKLLMVNLLSNGPHEKVMIWCQK